MITKLKKLWMHTFGDTAESVDAFFATGYEADRSAVICVDNQLISALYWLDYTWNGKKLAYIYAVATEENFRGQGFGRQLMEKAHAALQAQGYAGAVLVPAEKRLVRWYEKLGYQTFYRAKKQEFSAGIATAVTELSGEEYARLRQEKKPDAPKPDREVYDFFATYGSFYKAENCLFAASRQENTVHFQEFLGDFQKLPGIIAGMNAQSGFACVPDKDTTFAMYYPITEERMPDYFSFALD